MTNLKLIGNSFIPCYNENFSVNCLYDIVTPYFSSTDTEYALHVVSVDFKGVPLDEWIKIDISNTFVFDTILELHDYLLNRIENCHKINNDIVKSIVFKDGEDFKYDKNKNMNIFISYYTHRG